MTIEDLAKGVVETCERVGTGYIVAGAFTFSYYGILRATEFHSRPLPVSTVYLP